MFKVKEPDDYIHRHIHRVMNANDDGKMDSNKRPHNTDIQIPEAVTTNNLIGEALSMLKGKSTHRRRAATAALYYGEAYMQGIPTDEANQAARSTSDCYSKWWLQKRFVNHHNGEDGNYLSDADVPSHRSLKDSLGNSCVSNDSSSNPIAIQTIGRKRNAGATEYAENFRLKRPKDDCSLSSQPAVVSDISANEITSCSQVGDDIQSCSYPNRDTATSIPRDILINGGSHLKRIVKDAKLAFLHSLKKAQGCTNDETFQKQLGNLYDLFKQKNSDLRSKTESLKGVWLIMSNPNYQECLGRTGRGDFIYTLGRMSFDMFRPAGLRCSIQGIFNPIAEVRHRVPSKLRSILKKQLKKGDPIQTYK